MDNKNIGKWLKAARLHKGLSQDQLAEALNMTKANISAVENLRHNLSFFDVVKVSKICDYPLPIKTTNTPSNVEKIGKLAVWDSDEMLPAEEYVYLPYYKDVELAAGNGAVAEDETKTDRLLAFSRASLSKNNVSESAAACVVVRGNSMEPVLPDGSTVAIDTSKKQIIDGEHYAIMIDDMRLIKRLYRLPGGKVKIVSYNKEEYPDIELPLSEVHIIGWVFSWSVMR